MVSRVVVGQLLAPYWNLFENMVGVVLEVPFDKNVVLFAWGSFSKLPIYLLVSLLLVGISEIAVLPAWELNCREFA